MSFESVMAKVAGTLEFDADIYVVSLWGNTKKLRNIGNINTQFSLFHQVKKEIREAVRP